MSENKRGTGQNRMVEVVRLIFIALLGTAGFQIATNVGEAKASSVILGVFLGAATGYVIGGMFGRLTAATVSGVERDLRRKSASEIAMGVAGVLIAFSIAFFVSLPLLIVLPPLAAWPAALFIYLVLGWLGFRVARTRHDEIYALLGLKPRAAGSSQGEVSVIDTSVLIDGRIVELTQTGFLTGTLLVHSGVLEELQRIADASDENRRRRGRRGLDNLARLQKDPRVDVVLVEEPGAGEVDAALVRLARERGAALVTADTNLAKVAEALSVPVRSINALASVLRQPVASGDELTLLLIKEGREHGQAVGYLEDGTMVVVEGAAQKIGNEVTAQVANTLQTPSGRMIFATLAN